MPSFCYTSPLFDRCHMSVCLCARPHVAWSKCRWTCSPRSISPWCSWPRSIAACRRNRSRRISLTRLNVLHAGSGIDHMESRSMTGVSLIKIFFQPGTDANADVTQISNLAMADLRRLPQGTLPPVVLKVDASSLPVCLLTVEGQGTERDPATTTDLQYQIRNQIAGVPGATVPPPYGGKYRQIMIYVDPLKATEAHELSPMDVVRATPTTPNLILPAGHVRIGPGRLQHIHKCASFECARTLNGYATGRQQGSRSQSLF